MRNLRREDIENFVLETINLIGKKEKINLEAKKGKFDKKRLEINGFTKEHQVDIHIYLDYEFITLPDLTVIECKNYVDS